MAIKPTKNILFFGILFFWLIANLLVLFDIQYLYLRAIFSFIFLIIIPGLLIMLMLKIREISFWEYLVYTIGLSVAFLMFGGLFINWVLPFIGIDKPLSLMPLLISFDIFLLIFWIIALKRNNKISLEVEPPRLDLINKSFLIIPTIFPILSILGAITLNNHGPNYLPLIVLGGIAIYVFFVALLRKKLNKNIYPWSIVMVSLSLLLAASLRSWYVSGVDTNLEYYIFQLIKEKQYWTVQLFSHDYNACISVSILPTILSTFIKINNQYIFKLIIPIIFSFTPLTVYLFLKKFTHEILAFLAVFFFISQPTFINWACIPIRQEIALLFFALILLVLFNENFNQTLKNSLFIIFGFSMVVSHYTTTYLAILLFVFSYLIYLVLRKTKDKKPFLIIYKKLNLREKIEKSANKVNSLNGIAIAILIIFTFLWNSILPNSSNNLIDFTYQTIKNMNKIFAEALSETGSINTQWNIFYYRPKDSALLLRNYIKDAALEYQDKSHLSLYPRTTYENYQPIVKYAKGARLETTPAPKLFIFINLIKKLIKVFIIIGVLWLLFSKYKKRTDNAEYLIMTLFGFLLLGVLIILPLTSVFYETTRIYQQMLVILSLPTVLGGLLIFKFFKKNYRLLFILMIFILYFASCSGLIPYNIVGTGVSLQLHNFGDTYEELYVHETEVKSSEWLFNNRTGNEFIYADDRASYKLWFSNKSDINIIIKDVFPPVIDKKAYVYSSYTNVIEKRGFVSIEGQEIGYNFPSDFLNQNKNKIYNNGSTEIFK
jgi:uncharacterized membrane protein